MKKLVLNDSSILKSFLSDLSMEHYLPKIKNQKDEVKVEITKAVPPVYGAGKKKVPCIRKRDLVASVLKFNFLEEADYQILKFFQRNIRPNEFIPC